MPGRCRIAVVVVVAEIGKKKRDFPSFFMADFIKVMNDMLVLNHSDARVFADARAGR